MEEPLFYSAGLKIKRADHHIRQLIYLVNTFFGPDSNRVRSEMNAETAITDVAIKVAGKDLEDIPLIVGDAVHNLRAALEHVAYELVRLCNGRPTYHTRFTIGETRKEAVTSIEGEIQGIGLDMVTHILEYVQPYRGGNDALWTLHRLDIIDKHRLVVRVRPIVGFALRVRHAGEQEEFLAFGDVGEEEASMIRIHPGAEVEGYRNPMLHVLFDDVEGLKGQSVIPTLRHIREAVVETVQEVERAFLAIRR